MEVNENSTDVIQLLSKLRDADSAYPPEMLASRRQTYLKQLAQLGIGAGAMGAAHVLKEMLKSSGGSSIAPFTSTILETALIVAILTEAAAISYMNRDKVTNLIRTVTNQPHLEEVSTPLDSDIVPSVFESESTSTAISSTAVTGTVDLTETPAYAGTPSPVPVIVTSAASGNGGTLTAESTPNAHDDNGNHYGLTPKPERTIDPGGNANSGGNNPNPNSNSQRNNK